MENRRWPYTRLALLATVAAISFPALSGHAADSPLTFAEALRLAAARSRQLAAQDAAVTAAREMSVSAGQLPDPVLRFGIDNLPVDGADRYSVTRDFMTMRRIGVMQEFTREEKRRLRSERFKQEADKALAEKAAAFAAIQRDTALAWLDRHYTEALAAVIAEQAGQVKLEIVAAESAYRAGRGNQADVFAAHSTLVGLEDRASELARRISTAKTNLARWVGDRADAPLAGRPAMDSIRLAAGRLDTELARDPQIAILSRQEEIASTEARLARADRKSDWSVEATYQQRGPLFSNMVSIGVSIPLQWDRKSRQDRDLAAKLALADQAGAQREEALRARIGEVRAMVGEWKNDRERVERYERELAPLARQRTQATFAAYQGGKASLTEVLLARRSETEVLMQVVQLEMDTARVWAQLNFLIPDNATTNQTMEAK